MTTGRSVGNSLISLYVSLLSEWRRSAVASTRIGRRDASAPHAMSATSSAAARIVW